ncbi:MAG: DnaJ domain-containing protein [Kineothrix sp.]
MQNYYKVLGLDQGASQSEIKKAYFQLVRQHTPENDPGKFREIREAYEYLKKAEETGPAFPLPQDPWAVRYLEKIREYERKGGFALARDMCQEAFRVFPEEQQFRYLLAVFQRKAGNTGKAVKTGEVLVEMDPGNKWYWRELAMACIERGFTKKAFPYIKKAHEMGCADNDFLLTSSIACHAIGQNEEGMRLLRTLVGKEKRWAREEVPELLEAYLGLCVMEYQEDAGISRVLASCVEFLSQYSMYLEENLDVLIRIMFAVYGMSQGDSACEESFHKMLQIIQGSCGTAESQELISVFWERRMMDRLLGDERLGDTVKYIVSAYCDEELNNEGRTFAILDTKLCMLKEREEVLPQLEILEREYPAFYEKFSDFAQKLRSARELGQIKDALQRQYAALEKYMEVSRYYSLYPEERIRSSGKVIYQDEELRPYMRDERKVGRNDPCPCGSGKKYKKCCGR